MFNMLKHISYPNYAAIHSINTKLTNSVKIISPIRKKTIIKSALRNNIDDDFCKIVEVNKSKNEITISKIFYSDSDKLNDVDYIF